MSDLAAVEKTRDATLKALGKIDILVNNAGIAGINKTVWETDLDEWRKVLRINLDGPFICCKAIVPAMVKQNYGRIVNIASIAGKEGNPNAAHYSASKAGLIALTKSLGKELAGHDIARQRGDPGRGQNRDLRPDDAAAYRLHAVEDSEGTLRAGGGTRGDGGVAGVGGLRVLHRRGVRHFRRPGDVLASPEFDLKHSQQKGRHCCQRVGAKRRPMTGPRSNPHCLCGTQNWIASSRSLSSGAHSCDPLAPRNDDKSRQRDCDDQRRSWVKLDDDLPQYQGTVL